jgi:hypothetical protein
MNVDTAGTWAILPPGTPLMAKTRQAVKLFDLSAATLYRLRARYPDFRALTIKSGKDVLYDVPRCYGWFAQYLGADLDIDGEGAGA